MIEADPLIGTNDFLCLTVDPIHSDGTRSYLVQGWTPNMVAVFLWVTRRSGTRLAISPK
jgi:hypothetical protein